MKKQGMPHDHGPPVGPAAVTVPQVGSFTEPGQPVSPPKVGEVPNMNHSTNLPATDNTRPARKDPIPFGS